MKDIAVKFDLEKYVKLNTYVESATWNEESGRWELRIVNPDGSIFDDSCDILINGSGNLNSWKWPEIGGLDLFKGKVMHSAAWDDDCDMTDKTVAVIGGGSSSIQIIPSIKPKVKSLTAFIRNPGWITPGFGAQYSGPGGTNFEYSKEQLAEFNDDPEAYMKYCRGLEGELNKRFTLVRTTPLLTYWGTSYRYTF